MKINHEEALRILCLIGEVFNHANLNITTNPEIEEMGEVKLARRIAKEFPDLSSNVKLMLEGE